MGTMKEGKLLFSMAMPMIIAMLVQSLYNVVDSIFVAQISENALTAVSLAFPIQVLMIAVSVGLGVGINAILAKRLGAGDGKKASSVAMNGIFLIFLGYLLFLAFGLFGAKAFFQMQKGIPQDIRDGGTVYIQICTVFSFGLFFQVVFERLLQATGRTMDSLITQGTGAIINIILDPILIFGWFGFPKMGIAGAAVATVIGQTVACIIALFMNIYRNKEIEFSFRKHPLSWAMMKIILVISIPSIAMQALGTVMCLGMNSILLAFTPTATAVFGIYFKVQSVAFMPVFGLNNAMVPIVAYNYGAKQHDRMVKTIKLSMIGTVSMMLVGTLVIQLIPDQIMMLFDATPEMMKIGVPALRILSIGFGVAGVCIMMSGVFQALGNAGYSLIASFIRQIIVLLPAAKLLSMTGSVENVWWSIPMSELTSLVVCGFFYWRIYKNKIKVKTL